MDYPPTIQDVIVDVQRLFNGFHNAGLTRSQLHRKLGGDVATLIESLRESLITFEHDANIRRQP